jgi:hypothetical protein
MNQTETTNETLSPTAQALESAEHATAESLVASFIEMGTAWARYGLQVGKLALETSAQTLSKTAKALDALATNLEHRSASEPKSS